MSRPLTYLAWRSTVNRIRRRLRRLREPRYFIGLAVAGLYFYSVFFRGRTGSRSGSRGLLELAATYQDAFVLAGATLLLLLVTIAWLWPSRRRPRLHFSRADVQFLFPAPFTRRDLIRYKLLRSQVGVLIGSAVMTLLFRPGSLAAGWTFFAGMALLMMTVNVHLVGVSLIRHGQSAAGRGLVLRQRLPQLLVLGAAVALGASVAAAWTHVGSPGDLQAVAEDVTRRASTGATAVLLWPFRAVARLPLAASVPQFVQALPAVLGLLVLNYVWVVRSDVAFEEVAAEMAERRTNMGAVATPIARRGKAAAAPFQLGLDGRPETALLWKNLLLLGRYASVGVVVRVGIMLLVLGAVLAQAADGQGILATIAVVALIASGMAVFMGPQVVRNDLRQDLAYLDAVKLWPIRGAAIVRGEVLAPTLLLSGFVGFAVAGATVLSGGWTADTPDWLLGGPAMWGLAVVVVGSGLILAQVVAQNAVALLFPAWAVIGAPRTRGLEVMGQRMLMMAGMLLVVAGAAVPAAMAAAVVGTACWALLGTVPLVLPALAATAVLVFESLVAVEALGAVFERTDPTAVDPAGG